MGKIHDAIVEKDKDWLLAVNDKKFRKYFELSGESLKTRPRCYDKNHVLNDDLKRKDFIAISHFDEKSMFAKNFKQQVVKRFTDAEPYMQFLCKALLLKY